MVTQSFFIVGNINSKKYIYSCNIDGSNLKKIIHIEANMRADLVDIYPGIRLKIFLSPDDTSLRQFSLK
jgi:hypothetical protein